MGYIKKNIEITIKTNSDKPSKCSLECPYLNIIGGRDFPNDARCELYQTPLLNYLSFENCRWLWVTRCEQCKRDFNHGD